MTRGQMTPDQRERQGFRDETNGRYSEVNPCYLCRRSVGIRYYSTMHTDMFFIEKSGARTNFADTGLVLHEDCANLLDAMKIEDAFEFMCQDIKVRRGHLSYYRSERTRAARKLNR